MSIAALVSRLHRLVDGPRQLSMHAADSADRVIADFEALPSDIHRREVVRDFVGDVPSWCWSQGPKGWQTDKVALSCLIRTELSHRLAEARELDEITVNIGAADE